MKWVGSAPNRIEAQNENPKPLEVLHPFQPASVLALEHIFEVEEEYSEKFLLQSPSGSSLSDCAIRGILKQFAVKSEKANRIYMDAGKNTS